MTKLYNTQSDVTTKIESMIKDFYPDIGKNLLNIIPSVIFGLIDSESVVTSDIAKSLKGNFSFNKFSSNTKRIYRLLNNPNFDGYLFSHYVIKYVIDKFVPKHSDMRVHITFDHMFISDRFTIFMLTMRIGKQGFPIWFRCFEGLKKGNRKDAFQRDVILDGINYVSDLFKDKNVFLIFLADRWFGSHTYLLKHIDSLGHTYVIRVKAGTKAFFQPKYEKNKAWMSLSKLPKLVYHSRSFNDIEIFNERYKTNLVINSSNGHKETWYLLTNGNPKRAVKDYAYRFGAIECMFKSQKSNGFYLESTMIKNLPALTNLYSLVSFSVLWLTIIGTYFEKNKYGVFKDLGIKTSYQTSDGTKKRYLSLFNTGLTLFRLALNSFRDIRLSYSLKLYDI